jgi:hypothetical protein
LVFDLPIQQGGIDQLIISRPTKIDSFQHGTGQAASLVASICLSGKCRQQHTPSTEEIIRLTLNGLGEKKISFPQDGNSAQVHEAILDAFSAIEEGGGYEILRTGDGRSKDFILIPMPAAGFSVTYLKTLLGQAKAYLRLIRKKHWA